MTKTDTAVMSAKLNEEVIVQMIKEARPTLNAAQKSQPATRSAKFSLADFCFCAFSTNCAICARRESFPSEVTFISKGRFWFREPP